MISDQEWDEMRTAALLRLGRLRDEIKQVRKGNRADAIQGVQDAFRQGPQASSGINGQGAIDFPAAPGGISTAPGQAEASLEGPPGPPAFPAG